MLEEGSAASAPSKPLVEGGAPKELFRGAPSWKSQLAAHVAAGALVLAGFVAFFMLTRVWEQSTQTGLVVAALLLLVGLSWMLVLYFARFTHFRVTTAAIDVESGVIGKRVEHLPLWKVRDISYRQNVYERMLDLARIHIVTQDPSSPELELWGIPASREMFDRLKNAVDASRRRGGVLGLVE